MPQYDAYEEPLAPSDMTELNPGHDRVQPDSNFPVLTKINTPNRGAQPHIESGNGTYQIRPENNDPIHSAESNHTHARHASLPRHDSGQNLVPTSPGPYPGAVDNPKVLSTEEQKSLAALTAAQAEDDNIRLVLACERCGQDLVRRQDPTTHAGDVTKAAQARNGGWMHRSRGSCELLSDRPAAETWETKDLEALRARPRGAL